MAMAPRMSRMFMVALPWVVVGAEAPRLLFEADVAEAIIAFWLVKPLPRQCREVSAELMHRLAGQARVVEINLAPLVIHVDFDFCAERCEGFCGCGHLLASLFVGRCPFHCILYTAPANGCNN